MNNILKNFLETNNHNNMIHTLYELLALGRLAVGDDLPNYRLKNLDILNAGADPAVGLEGLKPLLPL